MIQHLSELMQKAFFFFLKYLPLLRSPAHLLKQLQLRSFPQPARGIQGKLSLHPPEMTPDWKITGGNALRNMGKWLVRPGVVSHFGRP